MQENKDIMLKCTQKGIINYFQILFYCSVLQFLSVVFDGCYAPV
jgi:hypothetical protein